MDQSQTIGPEYTVRVYNGTNLTIDEAALGEAFQGVLSEAKLPYGEYIIRIKHAATQGRGRSLEFSHTTQDIVTLFWFTANDVPDPGVAFRGILKIADRAIKEDLVLDLNEAALRYLCRPESSTPPEESKMSRNTAAQSGHDLIVRKDRTIHIGLPGRLTQLLRQILVTAQLPPGRYEYTVKEVTTATDLGTTRHHISVEKRVSRSEFGLTFKLSKQPHDTFIGELVFPGKAIVPDLYTKLCAAAEKLTKDRWGDNEASELPKGDLESPDTRSTPPISAPAEAVVPTTDLIAPVATTAVGPSLHERFELVLSGLTEHYAAHEQRLGALNAEQHAKLDAFIRELSAHYAELRLPIEEQLAFLRQEIEGTSKLRAEAVRLKLIT